MSISCSLAAEGTFGASAAASEHKVSRLRNRTHFARPVASLEMTISIKQYVRNYSDGAGSRLLLDLRRDRLKRGSMAAMAQKA